MKRYLILIATMIASSITLFAGGGKLVLLMEKAEGRQQDFVWELHPESYLGTVKVIWSYGKDVCQMKNTPNGWFISYEDENPTPVDQRFCFDKKGEVSKKIKEWNGMGIKATSLAYEGLDGLGRSYFIALGQKNEWSNDQIFDVMGAKKLQSFVDKHASKGYRITQLAGTEKAWGVVLSRGTDIIEQELCFYKDYDEMIEGVKAHWDHGWPVQLAEIDATGKYAVVYAEYSDGSCPEQYLSVCSTSDEAETFFRTHKAEGFRIVNAGGSFLPGLLCNYDSMQEKMNAIMGIAGGLFQTLQDSPPGQSSDSGSVQSPSEGHGEAESNGASRVAASGVSTVDCTLCLGSGRCKYCNGDGFNYTAGTAVQCNGCKGHIGKCKRCKGTGKISRSGKVKY